MVGDLTLDHCILSDTIDPACSDGGLFKVEPKRSLAHLCMCHYNISLHNNLEIYTKRLNKLENNLM